MNEEKLKEALILARSKIFHLKEEKELIITNLLEKFELDHTLGMIARNFVDTNTSDFWSEKVLEQFFLFLNKKK